jgi:hypothetical protein
MLLEASLAAETMLTMISTSEYHARQLENRTFVLLVCGVFPMTNSFTKAASRSAMIQNI